MKAKKKYLAVFPLCLGLSLLWHLIGALGIGTTPEPRSGFAQPVVPTLLLARPLEFLDVGADSLGKPVRRPVASETDPEYFGFPRVWAFGRFQGRPFGVTQGRPDTSGHVPWSPTETPLPEIVPSDRGYDWQAEDRRASDSSFQSLELPSGADLWMLGRTLESRVSPGIGAAVFPEPRLQLVLAGPIAQRACLVRIDPTFTIGESRNSHSLVLGDKKLQEGPWGLRIRLWVSPDGCVRCAFLESSSGESRWDKMALAAMHQWQFMESSDVRASMSSARTEGGVNSIGISSESNGLWQSGTVSLERDNNP